MVITIVLSMVPGRGNGLWSGTGSPEAGEGVFLGGGDEEDPGGGVESLGRRGILGEGG